MEGQPVRAAHLHQAEPSGPKAPRDNGFHISLPSQDFKALYAEHAATVKRWAARLGGPSIDADDVVQEVFCVVLRRLPDWDGNASIRTWLFRITHHVVRNWNRKRRILRWLGLGPDDPSVENEPSHWPSPGDELESKQAASQVQRALKHLSEKHRTLIVLFELEELSTTEIAELLAMKVGTVRVGLHRARAEFAKAFEALEPRQKGAAL